MRSERRPLAPAAILQYIPSYYLLITQQKEALLLEVVIFLHTRLFDIYCRTRRSLTEHDRDRSSND